MRTRLNQAPFLLTAFLILSLSISACGGGGGDSTPAPTPTNSIGSGGGEVTSSDGKVVVSVPEGALSQQTEITVNEATNPPSSGNIGVAYEFGPDGTTFSQPVTISITYDETALPQGVNEADLRLGEVENGQWVAVSDSSVDVAANVVTGTTTHFSIYGVISVNTNQDLAGEWFIGGEDLQQDGTWEGLMTFDTTGAITGGTLTFSEVGVPINTFTNGSLAIDTTGEVIGSDMVDDGVITQRIMQMDSSKNIMAGIGHATNAPSGGEDGLFVFVKKSAGFTTADLAGEWILAGNDLQDMHTWNGSILIDSTGEVTGGTLTGSDGTLSTYTGGNLTIDATGKVTGTVIDDDGGGPVTTQLTMQMDGSKNIIAGEGNATTSAAGEDGPFILIKKSSGFAIADLTGEWFLAADDLQDDLTLQGTLALNSTGAVTSGTFTYSDGTAITYTGGGLSIDATGKVTGSAIDSDGVTTSLIMQMDSSKNVIAGVGSGTPSAAGENGIFILIRKW